MQLSDHALQSEQGFLSTLSHSLHHFMLSLISYFDSAVQEGVVGRLTILTDLPWALVSSVSLALAPGTPGLLLP